MNTDEIIDQINEAVNQRDSITEVGKDSLFGATLLLNGIGG